MQITDETEQQTDQLKLEDGVKKKKIKNLISCKLFLPKVS